MSTLKGTKLTLKAAKACHPLAGAVLRQLGGGSEAIDSAIDAANHGADGGFHGFIYTRDTIDFYKRNRNAINAMAAEQADDLGEGTIALVRMFGCLTEKGKPQYTEEEVAQALYAPILLPIDSPLANIYNALAWYALEEVGRALEQACENKQCGQWQPGISR